MASFSLIRSVRSTSTHPSKGGFTIIEVMVCAGMLAIVATAVCTALVSSMRQTRLADEMRAASFEARRQLEQIGNMSKAKLVNGTVFEVNLNSATGGVLLLRGINGAPAGEIITIDQENAVQSTLGRDLTAPTGPDGVSLAPVPMDLTGDGVIETGTIDGTKTVKVVVGAVVRWITQGGLEQRYELWAVRMIEP